MGEVKSFQRLIGRIQVDSGTDEVIRQVVEFEKFLTDMKITIEKRQILQYREDVEPQMVYYNN